MASADPSSSRCLVKPIGRVIIRRIAIGALHPLTVPSIIVGYFLAPWILGIFGHPYAVHSTTLLRMQLLSMPFNAVMVIYTAYAWYDQRVWQLVFRQLGMLTIFLLHAVAPGGQDRHSRGGMGHSHLKLGSFRSSSSRRPFDAIAPPNRAGRSADVTEVGQLFSDAVTDERGGPRQRVRRGCGARRRESRQSRE